MLTTIELPFEPAGQHRWRLLPQPDTPVESLRAFVAAFRDFAVLGSAGAFVSPDADTANCVMEIRDQRRLADNSLEFIVDVAHCDPRYARVLRNIVFGVGEVVESPAIELRIDSAVPRANTRRLEAEVDEGIVLERQFYPEVSPQLGVPIHFKEPLNHRSGRRISVTFADALPVPLVNDLTGLVDLWASVVPAGFPGSEQELVEGLTFILNVTGCQHDDVTYEVLIEEFAAAEAALDSLVNLVVGRASRAARIVEVIAE